MESKDRPLSPDSSAANRSRLHRSVAPHAALGAAAIASIACTLLTRALGQPSGPSPTPQPAATSTPSPLSASEELQRAVPSSLSGLDVLTVSVTLGSDQGQAGDELDASDPAVAALLAPAGTDPSEVEIAASVASHKADANRQVTLDPGREAGVVFQAGAVRIPGRDWSAALDALAVTTGGTPPVTWDRVTVAGHNVLRGQSHRPVGQEVRDDLVPPIHYLASGDTLYYVQSSNAGAAEETIGGLPDGSTSGGGSASTLPPPGSSPLVILIMQRPLPPVCVAEPPGRQHLLMMALDSGLGGVPSPFTTFTVTGQVMASSSPGILTGPLADLPYAAARYGGGHEQLMIEARAVLGGLGVLPLSFDVQHCLYGTWQDEGRVLRIVPPFSDSFTAEIQSGTLCEEEGGVAFSGTLDGDRVSGSDLKTCSPQVCVDAGFLEKAQFLPFSGIVADDGLSVTIDWTGPFYQFEEDNQGNLLYCNQTSTEDNSFTITRLTFGD